MNDASPPRPNESLARTLGALLGLAFTFRLLAAAMATTMGADVDYYLRTAELMGAGEFEKALEYRTLHPFFPLLIALLGGGELAASGLSVVVSALGVIPLVLLIRAWWSERVAVWTGFIYALHPMLALESSEALPTGFFLGLFVAAVAAGVFALRGKSWALYPLAGLAAAGCYLTRTEGILAAGFLFLGAVWVGIEMARRRPRPESREWIRFLAGVGVAVLVFIAAAYPYVAWVSEKSGKFAITLKGGMVIMDYALGQEGVEDPTDEEAAEASGGRSYAYMAMKKFTRALFPALVPFLLAGLCLVRFTGGRWRSLIGLGAMALACAAPALLLYAINPYFRPSHRYFLAGVVFMLPWAAAGLVGLADGLARRFRGARLSRAIAFLPVLIIVALMLGKALRPRRTEEATFLAAGKWLSEQKVAKSRRVLSTSGKIAWYGGYDLVTATGWLDQPGAAFGKEGAAFLVLDEDSMRRHGQPDYRDALVRTGFVLLADFEGRPPEEGVRVWIYGREP